MTDVLVVGGGPAGLYAALRAGELGARTTLVTRDEFGGMAANEGTVPVRTLAHAARLIREARQLGRYGIAAFVICASLVRQYEFAQNVWVNDRSFHELVNERDPFIGTHDGTLEYKIPKRPIRKRIEGLPAFTTVRGGAYFFLPGIRALRFLAGCAD